jgi:hypothetical protein
MRRFYTNCNNVRRASYGRLRPPDDQARGAALAAMASKFLKHSQNTLFGLGNRFTYLEASRMGADDLTQFMTALVRVKSGNLRVYTRVNGYVNCVPVCAPRAIH